MEFEKSATSELEIALCVSLFECFYALPAEPSTLFTLCI